MPKSRKRKNLDFQKVKLKVGKKLPKGDNVTNLSFKTRQIQLTQRIKDGEGQDVTTKRKLSVQDLLRQCDHHSCSARVNAVAGLKELWFSNHKELMWPANVYNYGKIIEKISTLLIDNESVVRHCVIGLFKVMLHRLSSDSKSPPRGFPVLHIHTYLCCAMAHIHEDIKLDALLLFDVLLQCFPSLIIHQTGDLLTSMLGFISAPISFGTRADVTTQRLTLNPDSKLPVMKFRQNVLVRIKEIFRIALDDVMHKSTTVTSPPPMWRLPENDTVTIHQDTHIKGQTQDTFQKLFSGACHELKDYITNAPSLEQFVRHSVAVLLQCWKEARASVDCQHTTGNIISRESSEVMSLVVTIIQLAFNLCGTKRSCGPHTGTMDEETLVPVRILIDTHALEFERAFMADFPYCVQVHVSSSRKRKREKKKKLANEAPSQFSLDDLNLRLCEIMSRLCGGCLFERKSKWMSSIQSHLLKILQKRPSVEESRILVRTLTNLLLNGSVTLLSPVIQATVDYFTSCPTNSQQKREFFTLYELIIYNWNSQKLLQTSHWVAQVKLINRMYSDLPALLLAAVRGKLDTDWTLNILSLMVCGQAQSNTSFKSSLNESLTELLDPDTGICSSKSELVVERFFFLVSLGTPLSRDHYKQVLSVVRRPAAHPVIKCPSSWSSVTRIIQCLAANIRYLVPFANQVEFNQMSAEHHDHFSEYLSAMVSLLVGLETEELDPLSPVMTPVHRSAQPSSGYPLMWQFGLEGDQWDRHVHISTFVSQELCSVHIPACPAKGDRKPFSLIDIVEQLCKNTLNGRPRLHVLTAYGLLQLMCHASEKHRKDKPSIDLYTDTSQMIASLLVSLHTRERAQLTTNLVWQLKELIIKTLHQESPLLNLTWTALGDLERDSSVNQQELTTAKDFLLSDTLTRRRIEDC